jgi:arylsulfatase A-like enzyme
MFTGRKPSSLGVSFKSYDPSIPQKAKTLAEYLRTAGYYTAGFASTYCVKGRLGFSQGFDYYDDSLTDRPTSNKAQAAEMNSLALEWMNNTWLPGSNGKPLFLMLYYFDPHVYYNPPAPYDTLYDSLYTGTLTAEIYQNGQDAITGKIQPTRRDVEHLIALYDGEISYWDANLGRMLAYLQDHHFMDNTLVVVTSDHGETFGTHGKWTHGSSLYDEVLRVPLFMRYTGVIPPGSVSDAPAQNADLMPTILDFAGLPLPADLQSMSLRPQAQGLPGAADRPLFSELDGVTDPRHVLYWIAPRVSQWSIEQDDWKMIHYADQADQDELYELNSGSIYETENLIQNQPDRAQKLFELLSAWFRFKR